MNPFPTLNAPPWKLRQFKNDDLEMIKEASNDPLIPLITSIPSNFSNKKGMAYIERQWSRYETGTGYSFVIAHIDTDEAIGSLYVGLEHITEGRASIGYWIIKQHRGKGAAQASLKEIIKWAKQDNRISTLNIYAEPSNNASIKTALSVGFKKDRLLKNWKKIGDELKDMEKMSLPVSK